MPTAIEGIKFYKIPEVAEALKVTPRFRASPLAWQYCCCSHY